MSRYAFVFLGLVSFLGACSAGGESGGDPVIVTVPATGGSTGPSISVLSPASGSTGTEISILGSGFNGHLENNLIMFGTTALAPSSASESEVR
ncbi:MAG: IPT/TIG domain-containing protein, partial [Planctomycetota bacterium]|nr:IPT/TIG domain-containing protein [Planctomycetota bacterium]